MLFFFPPVFFIKQNKRQPAQGWKASGYKGPCPAKRPVCPPAAARVTEHSCLPGEDRMGSRFPGPTWEKSRKHGAPGRVQRKPIGSQRTPGWGPKKSQCLPPVSQRKWVGRAEVKERLWIQVSDFLNGATLCSFPLETTGCCSTANDALAF